MSITVVGSINLDFSTSIDRLPHRGETRHAHAYTLGLGGKGANQAAAAARLGHRVSLVARLGRDDFGRRAEAELQAYAIDLSHVFRDDQHPTGIAAITVAETGENTIAIVAGANGALTEADISLCQPNLSASRVLLLQLETPMAASLAAARIVKAAGGLVILDPAPAPAAGLPPDLIPALDILTPNETETAALLGHTPVNLAEARESARALVAHGIGTAVVKMGARGLGWATATSSGVMPAFAVKAIDTVAAGDCFNGGLAHALVDGMALEDALRFAAATAALSTTRRGAAAAAPTLAEVEAFLRTAKTV